METHFHNQSLLWWSW